MSDRDGTIGGFFGLELPTTKGRLPPHDATLLRSGRACLRAILETVKPRRLLAPFYVCDAAIAPAQAAAVPVVPYAIDDLLRPLLPEISDGDLVMVVDYFGLRGDVGHDLAWLGGRLVVDQTQALFATGPAGAWRFTSARKWFGVPDGGFLWGPEQVLRPAPAPPKAPPLHLIERAWGDRIRAYEAYKAAEEGFGPGIEPVSTTTISLLSGIDTAWVAAARRRNYLRLESLLAANNMLTLALPEDAVPFCYPMLPGGEVSKQSLANAGIFIPTFWAECCNRSQSNFAWEMDLSRKLLPLPIDHRYTEEDMTRVADHVLRLINQ